jgi:hypothetical protein
LFVLQRQQQEAVARLAWLNRRSRIAPLKQPSPGVNAQPAPQLLGVLGVTLITLFHQHGANFGFKKLQLLG